MSENWRRIARLDALKSDVPNRVDLDGAEIALHLVGGEVFATSNICSHAFARLSDGYIEGRAAICPMHEGGFDVATGAALYAPCSDPIATYPAKVENGDVFIAWKTP
jgi:nitrite reductase/ring-hydroxylating ferredoxin subunit